MFLTVDRRSSREVVGKTWAGATPPYRATARLPPRWSLPPTFYQRPMSGLCRYRRSTGRGRKRGPKETNYEQTEN